MNQLSAKYQTKLRSFDKSENIQKVDFSEEIQNFLQNWSVQFELLFDQVGIFLFRENEDDFDFMYEENEKKTVLNYRFHQEGGVG